MSLGGGGEGDTSTIGISLLHISSIIDTHKNDLTTDVVTRNRRVLLNNDGDKISSWLLILINRSDLITLIFSTLIGISAI